MAYIDVLIYVAKVFIRMYNLNVYFTTSVLNIARDG